MVLSKSPPKKKPGNLEVTGLFGISPPEKNERGQTAGEKYSEDSQPK